MIEKHIKICCTSSINKQRTSNSDQIWRSWKVLVRPMGRDVNASLSLYIDHVEYILHQSFETPRIVCTQEPYILEQEGWGEFNLVVVFHFRDQNIPPQKIMFDLHFKKPNYSAYKTLEISSDNAPFSLLQYINSNKTSNKGRKRKLSTTSSVDTTSTYSTAKKKSTITTTTRQRATSSASTSSIVTSSSSVVTTPTDGDHLLFFDDLQQQRQQQQQLSYCRSSQQQIVNETCPYTFSRQDDRSSILSEADNSSWNANVLPEEIDIPTLANSLELLNEDNLRKVYNIFLQYNTKDMLITETEDQVIFDLYSLGTSLLTKLWEFTKNLEQEASTSAAGGGGTETDATLTV